MKNMKTIICLLKTKKGGFKVINNELIFVKSKVEIRTNDKCPTYRKHRGIILEALDDEICLLSEEGQLINIDAKDIIYIKKTSFDRNVSDALNKLYKVHEKLIEQFQNIDYLNSLKEKCENLLSDAHMLSEFNLYGAIRNIKDTLSSSTWNGRPKKESEKSSFVFDIHEDDGYILLEFRVSKYIDLKIDENTSSSDFNKVMTDVKKENTRNLSEKSKLFFPNSIRIDFKDEHMKHISAKGYLFEAKYLIRYSVNHENFKERKKEIIQGVSDFLKIIE